MDLEKRIERLEGRCHRQWWALVICAAVGVLFIPLLGLPGATVRTSKIVIPRGELLFAAPGGRELAKLRVDDRVVTLDILDKNGQDVASLGGGGYKSGFLYLGWKDGTRAVEIEECIDSGGMMLYGELGTKGYRAPVAYLTGNEGGGILLLATPEGEQRAVLRVGPDDAGHLRMWRGDLETQELVAEWP